MHTFRSLPVHLHALFIYYYFYLPIVCTTKCSNSTTIYIWINAYDERKRLLFSTKKTSTHSFSSKWSLVMWWTRFFLPWARASHHLFPLFRTFKILRSVHLRFIVIHYLLLFGILFSSLPLSLSFFFIFAPFSSECVCTFLICDLFKWPLSSYFGNYAVRWMYIKSSADGESADGKKG